MKTILFVFIALTSTIYAQTFGYPMKKSLFSVTFPINWNVELDENSLMAFTKDESVEIDIWTLEQKIDINAKAEDSIKDIKDIVDDWVDNFKVISTQEKNRNGIELFEIRGSGIDRDSHENIQICINLLTTKPLRQYMIFWLGTEEALQKNRGELDSIISSIKRL